MWADESVFYQIYPLGFCGAPEQNDGLVVPRIAKVAEWIPHILQTGANAIYFSPLFLLFRFVWGFCQPPPRTGKRLGWEEG